MAPAKNVGVVDVVGFGAWAGFWALGAWKLVPAKNVGFAGCVGSGLGLELGLLGLANWLPPKMMVCLYRWFWGSGPLYKR